MVRPSLPRRLSPAPQPQGIATPTLSGLLRPSLLGVLTVLLISIPDRREDLAGGFHVTPADLASVALIGLAAFTLLVDRRRLPTRAWLPIPILLAAVLATFTATDLLTALPGLLRYVQIFVLIPLAVQTVIRTRTDAWLLLGAITTTAAVQAAVGAWQAATGTGASFAGENIRLVGTFGAHDVMGLATTVAYGWLILLGTALATRGRPRTLCLLGLAALSIPLTLSLSRGTWLAALCAALAMLLLYGVRRTLRVTLLTTATATLLVLGLGLGQSTIGPRVATLTSSFTNPDQSVSDRYSLWQTATGMWADHPLTGVGPRGFAQHRDDYAPLNLSSGSDIQDPINGFQRQPLLSPHNMYLLALSEQGILGLFALVLLLR